MRRLTLGALSVLTASALPVACASEAADQVASSSTALPATTTSPPPTTPAPVTAIPVLTTAPPPKPAATTAQPEATAPSTTQPVVVEDPAACTAALPVAFKAGQVLMPAVYGDAINSARAEIVQAGAGGAILMTWPDGSRAEQLAELKGSTPVPLLLATDEEGGDVQRLRRLGRMPSAREVAATMSPDSAYEMVAAHAIAVRDLGIDIVFAPVVDVAPVDREGPIGDRAFSSDPLVVVQFMEAYVDGWQSAGITPVLKHFPGHGSADSDTHVGLGVTPPLAEMIGRDALPYEFAADIEGVGVMVGHLSVPGLTDEEDVPASLSREAVTGFLREELGYRDALVFTDALEMQAIRDTFGVSDAAVRALNAGVDVIVFTDTRTAPELRAAITEAVADGVLPAARLDEAVERILARKGVDPCTIT